MPRKGDLQIKKKPNKGSSKTIKFVRGRQDDFLLKLIQWIIQEPSRSVELINKIKSPVKVSVANQLGRTIIY